MPFGREPTWDEEEALAVVESLKVTNAFRQGTPVDAARMANPGHAAFAEGDSLLEPQSF